MSCNNCADNDCPEMHSDECRRARRRNGETRYMFKLMKFNFNYETPLHFTDEEHAYLAAKACGQSPPLPPTFL